MLDRAPLANTRKIDYSVPPVIRAIKVLRHIANGGSVANQTRAAKAIGINRTTLLRLLCTLEAEGFIERVPGSDDYTLGTGVIELAATKFLSIDAAQAAQPVLTRLTAELGLSSHLGILDGREVLYVLRCAPNNRLVSNVQVGTRLPAHASTIGRAILAHMPIETVRMLYKSADLFAVTDKTPTTMAQLEEQLHIARTSGLAEARSSFEAGIDAIAAPVLNHWDTVVGAINASGPERAFNRHEGQRAQITAAVRRAAAEISKKLGHVERAAHGR